MAVIGYCLDIVPSENTWRQPQDKRRVENVDLIYHGNNVFNETDPSPFALSPVEADKCT